MPNLSPFLESDKVEDSLLLMPSACLWFRAKCVCDDVFISYCPMKRRRQNIVVTDMLAIRDVFETVILAKKDPGKGSRGSSKSFLNGTRMFVLCITLSHISIDRRIIVWGLGIVLRCLQEL